MPTPGTWREVPLRAFSLRRTLLGGQVFRWVDVSGGSPATPHQGKGSARRGRDTPQAGRASAADEFIGVIHKSVVRLRQDWGSGGCVSFNVEASLPRSKVVDEAVIADFFNAGIDLEALQRGWLASTGNGNLMVQWKRVVEAQQGASAPQTYLRVLRQSPEECLFSFLCSQNNHVSRIAGMIERLCDTYGEPIGTVGGKEWCTFPTAATLRKVKGLDAELRGLGFGYRSKFVEGTARALGDRAHPGLLSLRDSSAHSYEDVLRVLTALPGVGRKVADCVALFSLDRSHVIPVDTHILRLAKATLSDQIEFRKTLTPKTYNAIQHAFSEEFGKHAGWAHSMMFHSELVTADSSTRVEKGKRRKGKAMPEPAEEEEEEDEEEEEEQPQAKRRRKGDEVSRAEEEEEVEEEEEEEFACQECGATETQRGVAFASEAAVRRHVVAAHLIPWELYVARHPS